MEKSEEQYSPTTLYKDFAISDRLFHWESQNSTSEESEKGLSYIHHKKNNKNILLFVRERNKDQHGITMGYVFLGAADFVKSEGSKPMSITWKLHHPIAPHLTPTFLKLAVG